jgi:alanyl-tRNA synthetase
MRKIWECYVLSTGAGLRRKFLDFFGLQDHLVLPSASLVPKDDPSLLLTVAGMVPFKPYFQGRATPPHPRIATAQKCFRTADLEVVGKTARHHTFFEMLGNFSIGDYFKKESIAWSWEFLTKELGLSPADLWITVYQDDEEAAEIWHNLIGIPREKIILLGADTNFWEAGPVGPCGPCSEIHIDLGPEFGCGAPDCGIECDCGRYLELWNLVFTEFNREEDGKLTKLPRRNIDTGMGLERIASVMQGVSNNFETDLIFPLIEEISRIAGVSFGDDPKSDVALKVIADHSRGLSFLIADGVHPSNEGRGYVLRRILRRAVRFGRLLGIRGPFLNKLTEKTIAQYQDPYRELKERSSHIKKIVSLEEERFGETLEQGLQILQEQLVKYEDTGEKNLPGGVAFRLYDTFGFPLELTQEIVAERGMNVDLDGFQASMEEQRARARAARVDTITGDSFKVHQIHNVGKTEFIGYGNLSVRAQVMLLLDDGNEQEKADEGKQVQVILDQTPFYAEGGGQVGDQGVLYGPGGEITVNDTKSDKGGVIVHHGTVSRGTVQKGDIMLAKVDEQRRLRTARNHTATHLLHIALRKVLGDHVQQMGSLVSPERLRFDFSHFASLSDQELSKVEQMVNGYILENILVNIFEAEQGDPRVEGAIALFGEKYGDIVRIVEIGEYSKELCGGTHVGRTSELGFFHIISESGIGTGVRRIEALTGDNLLHYWQGNNDILHSVADILKVEPQGVPSKLESLAQDLHEKDKEIEQLHIKMMQSGVDSLLDQVIDIEGVKFLAGRVDVNDMDALRSLGDLIKDRLGSGVTILGSPLDNKVGMVCFISKDLTKSRKLHAGKLLREVARVVDGGGGGKPEMAQAGGKNPVRLPEALAKGKEVLLQQLHS